MKKTIAILALALFIGGISVPVLANTYETQTLISLQDDDPKKKAEKKKAEKSKEATKKRLYLDFVKETFPTIEKTYILENADGKNPANIKIFSGK